MRAVLLSILLSATPTAHYPSLVGQVVWNVGQGQWFTAISKDHCYHFDMGGEIAPLKKIRYHCKLRKNIVFLSHWDWDHISFLKSKQLRSFENICIAKMPQGKTSPSKASLLASYKACSETSILRPSPSQLPVVWSPSKFRNPNESSHVFIYREWLLPGDSTKNQEKIWQHKVQLKQIRFLLLGHHGSHTSTSEDLLKSLPFLRVAVASARFKKHGHPHSKVQGRLKVRKVPLLKTEDWGSIWHL